MAEPYISGELVYLRALEKSDLEACLRWMNDPEVTQYILMGRKPMNATREGEWIAEQYRNDADVVFAICKKVGDEHIGNCGLNEINWVDRFATTGIAIGEKSCWGKGYGTDAMRLVLRYAFEILNLRRVELAVFDFNERAIRSYKKLGFVEEGRLVERRYKNGRYIDEILMAISREAWGRAKR
jgi:RimJ/RimL family protein N-acetyltransferase